MLTLRTQIPLLVIKELKGWTKLQKIWWKSKKIEIENVMKNKIKDLLFASTGVIGEKFPVEKINKI